MKDISQIIELSNGRNLGYIEYGNPNAVPIFYFHGRDGSRLEAVFGKESFCNELEIRFVCPDRPGMGLSDFQKDRLITDWPNDIIELAEHLAIDKFAVLGGSGGTPYALACAYKIPDFLTGCAIVSGLGPYNLIKDKIEKQTRYQFIIARRFPLLHRLMLTLTLRRFNNEQWWEKNFQKLYKKLPERDQAMISDSTIKKRMINKTKEAYNQGIKGPAEDFRLYTKPWGFELNEIPNTVNVHIFHGELDSTIPVVIAQELSDQIPNCNITIYPDEGHMSTYINHFTEIIEKLKS